MEDFKTGDKFSITTGPHKGRTGAFIKNCSSVFPDHCRVEFDLKKRERIKKTAMVLKSDLIKA